MTEEEIKKQLEIARREGYDEAMTKIRNAIKLKQMGMSGCEITKKLDLPPVIVHAVCGE